MSYQTEREEFFSILAKVFPDSTYDQARALLRIATGSQRYNEITCSIDVGEHELARMERREASRSQRAREIAEEIGATIEENGDPRGYPIRLAHPSGRSVGVPGRGLPASAF